MLDRECDIERPDPWLFDFFKFSIIESYAHPIWATM
jgi:hypothetical protein